MTMRSAGPPRLGGVLGRYELVQVLGHGAMATVFRARDTHLGRQVAVKVMTLAVAARADSAERFRREAQAVAAVKHPGIVEIFDFVAATDTEPAYIVSELIDGVSLRRFLDERHGRVLPETAALLALPLAEALGAAHARGVVHRDLKPDNVLLERGGADRRVVLTDFGVAHVTGLETMTATGALVGSPAYMSPEQARGTGIVPASDIFALGVLLYEMATGHLPFVGKDALSVIAAINRGVFKRPAQVSGFVSPAFDDLCMRCLRLDAAERPKSAADVAAELRAFCQSSGVEPGPASLRPLLDDPAAFEAALRPRVADAAVTSARRHARRGELARALGELSRATAYVPGHAEAERLIATISSRRRWVRAGLLVAATAGVGAAGWWLAPQLDTWVNRPGAAPPARAGAETSSAVAVSTDGGARATDPGPVPTTEAAAEAAPASASVGLEREIARNKPRSRRSKVRAEPSEPTMQAAAGGDMVPATAERAEAAITASGPDVAAPTVVDAGAPSAEPAVARAHLAAPVRVEIYAAHGFCMPSVDEEKPQRLTPAIYSVKPGLHRIHCTLGGSRELVAELRIGAPAGGGVFRVRIAKAPGGRPMLDARATTRAE